ncbi:hypothetical protein [Chengkuizengella marina]|uniref:Uncharacterized protein n=1 Tax=Chengkuizengella marina TaxID=2507566 RepID=A0A6N9Q2I3_9BACL|nr:hypothetical protein [Chengkuizengella marina]NBI28498.1 hypothetical protein [Chengkuizengella marina]
MKKIIITLIAVLLLSVPVVNAEQVESVYTVESYIHYLENEGAIETLNQFKNLKAEDQEKFLEYINNPAMMFDTSDSNIEIVEKTITKDIKSEKSAFALASGTRTIEHVKELDILGLNVLKYKVEGTYDYNSSGATKAVSATGVVLRNLNPMVQTELTSVNGAGRGVVNIGNGIYTAKVSFDYEIGPLNGLDVQIGTYYMTVTGDEDGKISGSFWRS